MDNLVGLGAAFLSCVIGERIARTLASNITNISREIILEKNFWMIVLSEFVERSGLLRARSKKESSKSRIELLRVIT